VINQQIVIILTRILCQLPGVSGSTVVTLEWFHGRCIKIMGQYGHMSSGLPRGTLLLHRKNPAFVVSRIEKNLAEE